MADHQSNPAATTGAFIKGPQDVVFGLFVLLLTAIVLWAMSRVTTTDFQSISPTLFPRLCGYSLGVLGLLLTSRGVLRPGPPLESWPIRGLAFVVIAIVLFGALTNIFGYLISGFITVIVAGFGSSEAKLRELLLLAGILIVICYLLFTAGLQLSLPIFSFPGVVS
jgi:hypothetical protein